MKTIKNSKKSTPDKQPAVTGDDLLAAIEPLLTEHAKVATDKKYAAWVLACLRREIEQKRSPAPAPGYYGVPEEITVTFEADQEEDADFDHATI